MKKEKVIINWSVSINEGVEEIELEDINCTLEKWNNMSYSEKEKILQEFIDNIPSRVSLVVDNFELKI